MATSPAGAAEMIADRYRLEGPLGRGGMAEVLAGTDLRLQRPVAVKFLLPEMAAREDIRQRFEAEARAAASLTHPNAVAVYDTGEHDGRPYIVMERLPGETLADRIFTGPQDPAWVRQVAREVLGALAAAHAAGLVHRDVKPGNILITAEEHAKIADFGIAKSLEATDGSGELTGTGQLLGTPSYLPPERLDGAAATPQSDLYSLGVVLYEALTGRCPFPGQTPMSTAMAVAAGDYQPLHEARPGLDPALVGTVERAMATDPARRFESATAMAAALAEPGPTVALAGEPTLVNAVAPATSVLYGSRLTDTAEVPLGARASVIAGRRRVPLALIIGLIFVALLVAGLNLGDGSASDTRAPTAQTEPTRQPTTSVARSQAPQTTAATVAVARQPVIPAPVAPRGNTDDDADEGKADDKGKSDDGKDKPKGKDD